VVERPLRERLMSVSTGSSRACGRLSEKPGRSGGGRERSLIRSEKGQKEAPLKNHNTRLVIKAGRRGKRRIEGHQLSGGEMRAARGEDSSFRVKGPQLLRKPATDYLVRNQPPRTSRPRNRSRALNYAEDEKKGGDKPPACGGT